MHWRFPGTRPHKELKDWDLVLDSVLFGSATPCGNHPSRRFWDCWTQPGGSFGILMAERVPQIQSVVAWGAIQTFHRYDAETQRQWRASGALEIPQDPSGKKFSLGLEALDALERNHHRLDVQRAIRNVNIPVLFVHGRDDKRVKLSEAQALSRGCQSAFVQAAHHRIGGPHVQDAASVPEGF